MSTFARLAPLLQQAIVARLGWSSLRPVQELAGEALLDGKNAVVLAPTAGGKTEAALFPLLSQLVLDPPTSVGVLYLAPIKALLNNQADRLGLYTEMVGLSRTVWHGDVTAHERRRFLAEPSALLMTTPESLEVMLISQRVDAAALFCDLRAVVIDEVHAVAGTDRGAHLMSVIERLAQLAGRDVQRVGLSATVGNPADILRWLQGTSAREGAVVDPPKAPARRQILVAHRKDLQGLAGEAAKLARGHKSLLFCQTRAATEAMAAALRRAGTAVFVHHSAVSREERELAEERFHQGTDACIVCTSTLELGIDVGDLDRVLQAEAPATVSSFLQRMGRTGRRDGQAANTTFLCESTDSVLQAVALVELARAGWVESVPVTDRCWPVLVHQILAMALASDGVTPAEVHALARRVPDFRGITNDETDGLIAWMVSDRSLNLTAGRLVLGPEAERRFGRRNFMELYAVFTSPQTYTVQIGDRALGTLSQDFVDRLVEGVSCFLLGGRAWAVVQITHGDRSVKVEAAPRGREPTWGGFVPQYLGLELCRGIRDAVSGDGEIPYLEAQAREVLRSERERFAENVGSDGVEQTDTELRWWTWAGGRINATVRHALLAQHPSWTIIPDNFSVRVRGEAVSGDSFRSAVRRLRDPAFWSDESLWREVAESLPSYRLSKFQPLLPPSAVRETLSAYLLDVHGARRWAAALPD